MNVREFEQRFLELIFRTNLRLTPHVVAYRLGLSVSETRGHLDRLAREGTISLEVDASGILYYDVPGAERPSRDWTVAETPRATPPSQSAAPSQVPSYGQWFSGPASTPPPMPAPRAARLASPRRSCGAAWLWLPALMMGMLFFFPLLFAVCFFAFQDLFGVLTFFFLGISVMRLLRGAACRLSYDEIPRGYRTYRDSCDRF